MRLIGNLKDHKHAERFVAYLVTQEIQSHIEPENEEFEIWIKDEDSLTAAVSALDAFRESPDDSQYLDAPNKARQIQHEIIRKRKVMAKNVVNVSDRINRKNHSLTILLMVICGVVALLTNFAHPTRMDRAAFRSLAFAAEPLTSITELPQKDDIKWRLNNILGGEGWRLITPIFLHFDMFHLLFNMYWLFVLGGQIENRYGTVWFGALVLGSAAISNFMQCVVPDMAGGSAPVAVGQYFVTAMGGMSGVNYALLGFIWMRIIYDPKCGLQLGQTTAFILFAWLIFCMTPIASQEFGIHTANWCHAIGMLVGVVAGYWPALIPMTRNTS